MANQIINRLKLGVFVTVGLILFTIAVYYIGNKQNMFGSTITLSTVFRNVNGLQPGNNVRYSGINIGTVASIGMVSDTSVQVEMIIDQSASAYIRKDAIATINSDGLVGNMMVSIVPTDNALAPVEPGDMIASYSRIGADDMLRTLNTTNENAALLTADLLKITEAILEKRGTLGVLLYDSSLAKDLKATLYNLRASSIYINSVSGKINTTLENLNEPNGLLGRLSGDTTLAGQLDHAMFNLTAASEEIVLVTKRLDGIVEDMKTGSGTINTLIYDTAFVHDLKKSMENVNKGTERFSENMEALKHNFLTRRYFKRQEKKEKKNSRKEE